MSDQSPPHFFETTCTLITVMLLGWLLKARANRSTAAPLDDLVRRAPSMARLTSGPEAGRSIFAELVELGDELEVLEGENIPVDGLLFTAECAPASFDESPHTGESWPVPRVMGDQLIGGSKLATGRAVRVRAERVGSGTALSLSDRRPRRGVRRLRRRRPGAAHG